MMFVRLALIDDEDAVVEMARDNITSSRPDMTFDEHKCRETFHQYLASASPTIWVVEHKREAIAFMLADMYNYRAAEGFYTVQEVLYCKPDHRGSRAAPLLMKNFIDWSIRLGANEVAGGVDNEENVDRTAKFLGHYGLKKVGYAMRRSLNDGR